MPGTTAFCQRRVTTVGCGKIGCSRYAPDAGLESLGETDGLTRHGMPSSPTHLHV
jgi:hypothetical protein